MLCRTIPRFVLLVGRHLIDPTSTSKERRVFACGVLLAFFLPAIAFANGAAITLRDQNGAVVQTYSSSQLATALGAIQNNYRLDLSPSYVFELDDATVSGKNYITIDGDPAATGNRAKIVPKLDNGSYNYNHLLKLSSCDEAVIKNLEFDGEVHTNAGDGDLLKLVNCEYPWVQNVHVNNNRGRFVGNPNGLADGIDIEGGMVPGTSTVKNCRGENNGYSTVHTRSCKNVVIDGLESHDMLHTTSLIGRGINESTLSGTVNSYTIKNCTLTAGVNGGRTNAINMSTKGTITNFLLENTIIDVRDAVSSGVSWSSGATRHLLKFEHMTNATIKGCKFRHGSVQGGIAYSFRPDEEGSVDNLTIENTECDGSISVSAEDDTGGTVTLKNGVKLQLKGNFGISGAIERCHATDLTVWGTTASNIKDSFIRQNNWDASTHDWNIGQAGAGKANSFVGNQSSSLYVVKRTSRPTTSDVSWTNSSAENKGNGNFYMCSPAVEQLD